MQAVARKRGDPWGRDDKQRAAAVYVVTGIQSKAAAEIGADRQNIYAWITNGDPEWLDCVDRAREAYDQALPHTLAAVIEKSLEVIQAKLSEASADQAARVLKTAFDTRQIISNKPTSVTASAAETEKKLESLVKRFERLTKPKAA